MEAKINRMSKKDLIIKKDNYSIQSNNELVEMSAVLKKHVVKHELYTNIKGKNYAHVEGWQFAGGLIGLIPRVEEIVDLSNDKEIKWFCKVNIYTMKDEKLMGTGYSVCSNKESKRRNADEYVIMSMAQTRAIGKAYRNILGWVMKLAGYEATPAEDMPNTNNVVVEDKDDLSVELEQINNTKNIEDLRDIFDNLDKNKKNNITLLRAFSKKIEEFKQL